LTTPPHGKATLQASSPMNFFPDIFSSHELLPRHLFIHLLTSHRGCSCPRNRGTRLPSNLCPQRRAAQVIPVRAFRGLETLQTNSSLFLSLSVVDLVDPLFPTVQRHDRSGQSRPFRSMPKVLCGLCLLHLSLVPLHLIGPQPCLSFPQPCDNSVRLRCTGDALLRRLSSVKTAIL
jgi:hypothetical protein